ncbi:MAG: 2,4'-dihydroxyacetophenone dioxygenase family protein [Sporichthyaceae bacterium]
MTTTAPAPATTRRGAALPFVALPQTELLTVNERDIPLLTDAIGPGVHFKPLRLDLEAGCWTVLVTLVPGTVIPLHYHTGTAEVLTLQGSWNYVEYPDEVQTAGSYLFEPGGSVHTLTVPATNAEDTVVFVRVEGANVNFNEDGTFHSILDAVLLRHLADTLADAQGVGPIAYIAGGAARLGA